MIKHPRIQSENNGEARTHTGTLPGHQGFPRLAWILSKAFSTEHDTAKTHARLFAQAGRSTTPHANARARSSLSSPPSPIKSIDTSFTKIAVGELLSQRSPSTQHSRRPEHQRTPTPTTHAARLHLAAKHCVPGAGTETPARVSQRGLSSTQRDEQPLAGRNEDDLTASSAYTPMPVGVGALPPTPHSLWPCGNERNPTDGGGDWKHVHWKDTLGAPTVARQAEKKAREVHRKAARMSRSRRGAIAKVKRGERGEQTQKEKKVHTERDGSHVIAGSLSSGKDKTTRLLPPHPRPPY
ncbi:hypothetical protein B0H14DRAFT_2562260 [Mycena olivaceomarginata]|nr:hypothetical protein B0H14DRAFT_2562260 [Mycena olivaceomarginata]